MWPLCGRTDRLRMMLDVTVLTSSSESRRAPTESHWVPGWPSFTNCGSGWRCLVVSGGERGAAVVTPSPAGDSGVNTDTPPFCAGDFITIITSNFYFLTNNTENNYHKPWSGLGRSVYSLLVTEERRGEEERHWHSAPASGQLRSCEPAVAVAGLEINQADSPLSRASLLLTDPQLSGPQPLSNTKQSWQSLAMWGGNS